MSLNLNITTHTDNNKLDDSAVNPNIQPWMTLLVYEGLVLLHQCSSHYNEWVSIQSFKWFILHSSWCKLMRNIFWFQNFYYKRHDFFFSWKALWNKLHGFSQVFQVSAMGMCFIPGHYLIHGNGLSVWHNRKLPTIKFDFIAWLTSKRMLYFAKYLTDSWNMF